MIKIKEKNDKNKLVDIFHKLNIIQIIKFGLVGVLNTLVSYLCYILVIKIFGETTKISIAANTFGFVIIEPS